MEHGASRDGRGSTRQEFQDEGEKHSVARTLEQIRRALQYGKGVHSRRSTSIRAGKGMNEPGRLAHRYRKQVGYAHVPGAVSSGNKSKRGRQRDHADKSGADKGSAMQQKGKEQHDVASDT